MRFTSVLGAVLAAVALGCSARQPSGASSAAAGAAAPPQQAAARPLPFKGRLVSGDPSDLPPAVAASLADNSSVTFSYTEELSHDEYHIPLIVTALDPVTYVGAPLGDFGVTASASLLVMKGNKVLGDYPAKAHVSKYYTLYSQPTHKELEDAARAKVRERIDQKLYRDADRLAAAVAASSSSSGAQTGK
jgi:hypothetical protein